MSENKVIQEVLKEINTSNSNIENIAEVMKEQIQTNAKTNEQNVKAFVYDREMAKLGVEEIGKAIDSNNKVVTNTISKVLEEFGGMREGLKDVADHLKNLSDQLIEHRVLTTEWRSQHEKEGLEYRRLFTEIEDKLDNIKEDVNEVKIDMVGIKTRQEDNKELNATKIASVDQRHQNSSNITHQLTTKQISMWGVIIAAASFTVSQLLPLLKQP
jgi:hypothetical protein